MADTSSAGFNWNASREAAEDFGLFLAQRLLLPNVAGSLAASGMADLGRISRLAEACDRWWRNPDAVAILTMFELTGHRPALYVTPPHPSHGHSVVLTPTEVPER